MSQNPNASGKRKKQDAPGSLRRLARQTEADGGHPTVQQTVAHKRYKERALVVLCSLSTVAGSPNASRASLLCKVICRSITNTGRRLNARETEEHCRQSQTGATESTTKLTERPQTNHRSRGDTPLPGNSGSLM